MYASSIPKFLKCQFFARKVQNLQPALNAKLRKPFFFFTPSSHSIAQPIVSLDKKNDPKLR